MLPLTKIIATIGPSCHEEKEIKSLILKGVNIFRFNLRHNDLDWHKKKIELIKKISKDLEMPIGILIDLEGGELRTGKFEEASLGLQKGETVIFSKMDEKIQKSSYKTIPFPKIEEFFSLEVGQKILIDDGAFEFQIKRFEGEKIFADVLEGGLLGERKTINVPGHRFKSLADPKNDLPALKLCSYYKADFLAISFVKESGDVKAYKKYFKDKIFSPWIISKIETREAIENFDEILEESNGIMVARGDLGTELPFEEVPFYQKEIIKKALVAERPVITATHMLESMVENPKPTRAEASDVANALYDLSDCVMLSKETASGKYPALAVSAMRQVSNYIEKQKPEKQKLYYETKTQTDAICRSAHNLYKSEFCQKEKIAAFVALTRTGKTAVALSRLRPYLPIFAITEDESMVTKLTMLFGVHPFCLNLKGIYKKKKVSHIKEVLLFLKKRTFLKKGDKVIFVYGEDWGTSGKTSVMRIQEVV